MRKVVVKFSNERIPNGWYDDSGKRWPSSKVEYDSAIHDFCVYTYAPPQGPETKPSNPKDQVGVRKVPMHTVPPNVLMEVGLAMLEGAKYGEYNYRAVGVQGSVYYDAAMRHLYAWWNGEDIDPDSGLPHLAKAIASLVVLRDGIFNGKFTDDRPPAVKIGWIQDMNKQAGMLLDRIKDRIKPKFTELSNPSGNK